MTANNIPIDFIKESFSDRNRRAITVVIKKLKPRMVAEMLTWPKLIETINAKNANPEITPAISDNTIPCAVMFLESFNNQKVEIDKVINTEEKKVKDTGSI